MSRILPVILTLFVLLGGGMLVYLASPEIDEPGPSKALNGSIEKEQVEPSKKKTNQTLYIGTISNRPVKSIARYKPLADYLNKQLQDTGVHLQATAAKDLKDVVKLFKEEKFHILVDSAFPVFYVDQEVPLNVGVRRWKKGIKEYHSVVMVRADGPVKSLEGLKGKRIAFEDPWSSAGYLLPKAELMTKGLPMVKLNSVESTVPPEKIGFCFSMDEENTIMWVLNGKVEAGAIDNFDYDAIPAHHKKRLKVVHATRPLPRHLLAYKRTVGQELSEKITEILLAMENHPKGQTVLENYKKTKRFDRLEDTKAFRRTMTKMWAVLNRE